MRHHLTTLALVASTIVLVAPAAQAQSLDAQAYTRLGTGKHMETSASLDKASGQISAQTHTWNNIQLIGFTGLVGIVVIDDRNRIIAVVDKWPFGVDGKAITWKVSDRRDAWTANIDPSISARAARIEIYHTQRALNRFDAILKEAAQRGKEAGAFARDMCREFADACGKG